MLYDKNLAQSQHILKKIGKKKNFSEEINSGNLELVAKMTSLGLGHGVLPTTIASRYKSLKVLPNSPKFKDEVCLVYRPEKHNNPTSQKILKILRNITFQKNIE